MTRSAFYHYFDDLDDVVVADVVAERYKVSREYQDEYSLESQRRMAAAQQALCGAFV